MAHNYAETPAWALGSAPNASTSYNQNKTWSEYSNSSYLGSPTPVSPSNAGHTDSASNHYLSPKADASLDYKSNNHYPSPGISPGDWFAPSPNNPSPTRYDQYAYVSPNSDGSSVVSPSSVKSEPFMYAPTPQKLNLPRELGAIDKSELDIGRERVAGARALCLMQETFGARPARSGQAAQDSQDAGSSQSVRPGQTSDRTVRSSVNQDTKREYHGTYPQRRIYPVSKEKLATSTRKKKIISAEEDFENISDFKCQLDFDRQKSAQKKALRMLSHFG